MWANQRAAPLAVSLPEVYAEAGLLPALAAWLLPPALPLDPEARLPQGTRAALMLLGALFRLASAPSPELLQCLSRYKREFTGHGYLLTQLGVCGALIWFTLPSCWLGDHACAANPQQQCKSA